MTKTSKLTIGKWVPQKVTRFGCPALPTEVTSWKVESSNRKLWGGGTKGRGRAGIRAGVPGQGNVEWPSERRVHGPQKKDHKGGKDLNQI